MGFQVSKEKVNKYLLKIKELIDTNNYRFEARRKNIESLAKVGLLPTHVKKIILEELTYKDYFNGPEQENDPKYRAGEILFFGYNIENIEFYIKIKIQEDPQCCVCLSFHDAEKRIYYPYKKD